MTNSARYFAAIDATWPAAGYRTLGPWRMRDGAGGGKRVSAASLIGDTAPTDADIDAAAADMQTQGQPPLFMVRDTDTALDAALGARGYDIIDPVQIHLGDAADIGATPPPPVTTFQSAEPLAIMREIWQDGGIGPSRIAVMARAQGPKTYLLGRINDRAAGVAYVAISQGIAMLHALEVHETHRRHGLGRHLMAAAARWATQQGARDLCVLVTTANQGANALYASLGMQGVGQYHYRIKEHP